MARLPWQRALLPMTIAVMLVAFTERAGTLAKAATSGAEEHAAVAPVPVLASGNGKVDIATGASPKPAPAKDADEMAMLGQLKQRRDALDKREAELNQRAELVAAAEQKLQQRLDQLGALQSRLEQADLERRQRVSANWSGLVKTYEAMKPDEAAAIFNVLDTDVLLEVLDRMDARKEAQVLAAMLPERARQATQMLARKRLQENAPDPAQADKQRG